MELHDAIINVVRRHDTQLSVREIWNMITTEKLYLKENGELPELGQIHARINQYPHLFKKMNGLVHLINTDHRLLRITWNTNGWETPVQHKWSRANQDNPNIAYENQYGFGGEEWLFNPRYSKDGYQYGYIRGITKLDADTAYIEEVILFTQNQETREKYLVGKIFNLEILRPETDGYTTGVDLFDKYYTSVLEEIRIARADPRGLNEEFVPCVRFKIKGSELFDSLIPAPELKGRKYNRFVPYHISGELQELLEGKIRLLKFQFIPGISKNTKSFKRDTNASSGFVKRVHGDITDDLVKYFAPMYSVSNANISVEKTFFRENVADVVLRHSDKKHTIIEVKTTANARRNIREALGQLIDYAYWYDDLNLSEMIIVSPAPMGINELAYFKRIQKTIDAKISYWQYDINKKELKDRFIKVI